MGKEINRIKAVLAEAGKTNLWLAKQPDANQATVSKRCTNTCQPDLHTLS
ncbi:XRE family transcriptional regulator [Phocaeicola vulgatus]|nr:XRE family transcriptional regulator [Phocaeicola vulgatus]MBV3848831.1 XRE family transcriptional regulator [Phocaeicola vulgatus]MBV3857801.1 XRE family transcriptional regulator [Phocaeicola vulgatus]MBV3861903.1 XRE family transcriptional regulator [Phocaeicola vulgatus]MBV3869382.1 XRE family transcriptional regulator [Phocaeicola vulgatus]MBV3886917.1 XRE family transcriptional regulator [Phocaeicola vulgatus]